MCCLLRLLRDAPTKWLAPKRERNLSTSLRTGLVHKLEQQLAAEREAFGDPVVFKD
jgi:hypothetical protein